MKNSEKGSALVFTMILITNAIIIISSIAFLSSMQNRASGGLFLTTKAFQKVDGGLEYVLMKINDGAVTSNPGDPFDGVTIKDLAICDSDSISNDGICEVKTGESIGDVYVWFYEKSTDDIVDDIDEEVGNIEYVKVSAEIKDGSNKASRSLKVSLFPVSTP